MWSICMCLHCVEVCTRLYVVRAGSCRKCELRNWGDAPWDNLWCLTQPQEILEVWGVCVCVCVLQRAEL